MYIIIKWMLVGVWKGTRDPLVGAAPLKAMPGVCPGYAPVTTQWDMKQFYI